MGSERGRGRRRGGRSRRPSRILHDRGVNRPRKRGAQPTLAPPTESRGPGEAIDPPRPTPCRKAISQPLCREAELPCSQGQPPLRISKLEFSFEMREGLPRSRGQPPRPKSRLSSYSRGEKGSFSREASSHTEGDKTRSTRTGNKSSGHKERSPCSGGDCPRTMEANHPPSQRRRSRPYS